MMTGSATADPTAQIPPQAIATKSTIARNAAKHSPRMSFVMIAIFVPTVGQTMVNTVLYALNMIAVCALCVPSVTKRSAD